MFQSGCLPDLYSFMIIANGIFIPLVFPLFLSLTSRTFLAVALGFYHSVNGIIIKIN